VPASTLKYNPSGTSGRKKRRIPGNKVPVKRSINLVDTGKKPVRVTVALPLIILIVIAALAISKFAVIDRYARLNAAESEVARLRSELNAGYAKIDSFGELKETYAHYTYSGMTAEELQRVDRADIVEMIQHYVISQAKLGSWSVAGNVLTLSLTRSTLEEVNVLAQQLNGDDIVDFCTVQTASTSTYSTGEEENEFDIDVTAQIIVYLKPVTEEG